jgi:outer membrane protein OmpA-like peptidoglycan-associated protein
MFKMSRQSIASWFLAIVLIFTSAVSAQAMAGYPNPGPRDAIDQKFNGAYIIDAGAVTGSTNTQTINQGLKPYGLIYALVKAKVPVEWVINDKKTDPLTNTQTINQSQGNNGTDFTFDCDGAGTAYASKNYRTGAFVVPNEFSLQAKPVIDAWKANSVNAGLVVDGPCTATTPTLPVFSTITSWPRAILDAQNGAVAVTYFNNAGIPGPAATIDPANPPAYRFAAPSQLTPCDDIYVMPHADPTWATHKELLPFVKSGGALYASCHAVSEVENMRYPAANDGTFPSGQGLEGKLAMNFLATGNGANTDSLVHYGSHAAQGSVPYSFFKPTSAADYVGSAGNLESVRVGDPIAQFLGVTDAATQQGSEQIFIPISGSKWRSTTQIVTYDPTQADATAQGTGPAASVLYGPAFGDAKNGWVMYEGGHSLNKGTVGDVAAQRAFFNFLLLTAIDRRPSASTDPSRSPIVNVTSPAPGTAIASGSTSVPLKASASGGSGSYSYKWSAQCFDASRNAVAVPDSSFGSTLMPNTTFTAPASSAGQVSCNLTLQVIDTCGRFSFGYSSVTFSPPADLRLTVASAPSPLIHVTANGDITYTYSVYNAGQTAGGLGDGRTATAATLTSAVPAGTVFTSAEVFQSDGTTLLAVATCNQAGGSISCDLGDLADETTVKVVIKVKVNSDAIAGTITSRADVASKSADSDLTNNNVSTYNTKDAVGIKIAYATKTVYADANGSPVTYSYRVTNLGTNPLTTVVVSDDKLGSAHPTYVSGDTDSNNQLESTETWIYTSTRTITWATPDSNPANNPLDRESTATATGVDGSTNVSSTDTATVQIATFSLLAKITPLAQTVPAGGNANVTLTVKNTTNQPVALNNINVWSSTDAGGSLTCALPVDSIAIAASGATFQIGSLEQNASWTVDCLISGVTAPEGQSKIASLSVSAANPLKNSAAAITDGPKTGAINIATPKLILTKVAKNNPLPRGASEPYTVTLRNADTEANTSVVLRDTVQDGMTLGSASVKFKQSGGPQHTYARIGVLASDKFYYSSSTLGSSNGNAGSGWVAGSVWSTNDSSNVKFLGNTADNNYSNEKYSVKFSSGSTTAKTLTRKALLNGDLAVDSTYLNFDCVQYFTTSTSSAYKIPTLTVKVGGAQIWTGRCQNASSTSRTAMSLPIQSSLLGVNAPAGGSEITFEVAIPGKSGTSSSSSAVVFLDDITIVSGQVASSTFTAGLGTSNSPAGGSGWADSNWTKAGTLSANLNAYSKYGNDIEWTANSSSTSTSSESITRGFNLSSADWQNAALSFSCRHEAFDSPQDFLKVSVGGVVIFNEQDSGTASCGVGASQTNSRSLLNLNLGSIAPSASKINIVIEMAGDKNIGIDDIYLSAGPSGAASASNTDRSNVAWEYDSVSNRWYINIGTLQVGETATISYVATIDWTKFKSASSVTNIASAVSNRQTDPVVSTEATKFEVSLFTLSVTANVNKILSGASYTLTYVLKNNGDVASTTNALVDDNGTSADATDDININLLTPVKSGPASVNTTDTNLDPGETWTYTRTFTGVTTDKTDAATFTGQTTSDTPTASDDATVLVVSPSLSFTVDHANHYLKSGETAEFVYTVTNTGNDPIASVVITPPFCKTFTYVSGDLNGDGVMSPDDGINAAEAWVFMCVTDAITVSAGPTNASAVGVASSFGSTVTAAPISIQVTVIAPAISVTKVVNNTVGGTTTSTPSSGAWNSVDSAHLVTVDPVNSVSYTYTVSNTGDSAVHGITISDSDCSSPVYPAGKSVADTLAVGQTWVFTCTAALRTQTIDAVAYATALDVMEEDVQSNAVSAKVRVLAPHLILEVKSATEYVKYGQSTTFTYSITNDGEVNISSFTPASSACSPLVGPTKSAVSGSANGDNVLDIGEIFTYTCTIANFFQDTLDVLEVSNVNSASGATGYTPAPSGTKVFVIDPNMTVTQSATVKAAGVVVAGPATDVPANIGDTVIYNYTVSSGAATHGSSIGGLNTMLINSITDAQCSPIEAVVANGVNTGDTNANGSLDPSESWNFSCIAASTLTSSAAVVDAQATVQAASVAESFTIRPASVRVRIAGASPSASPSPSSSTTYEPSAPVATPTPSASATPKPTSTPTPSASTPGTPAKLVQKVYFKGDSAALTKETLATLKALAKKAKKYGGFPTITVIGKVKETNDKSYDAALSKQRAVNVAKQIKKLGILGNYKTVAAGISPENQPISRRVEITMVWKVVK